MCTMSFASASLQHLMLFLSISTWSNCLSFPFIERKVACVSGIFLYMVLSATNFRIIGHCFIQRLFDSLRVYGPTRRCSAATPGPHSALNSLAIIRVSSAFCAFLGGLVSFFNVVVCASRVWEVYTHQHDFLSVDFNQRCYCTLIDVLCPLNLFPHCVQSDSDAVFVSKSSSTHAVMTLV